MTAPATCLASERLAAWVARASASTRMRSRSLCYKSHFILQMVNASHALAVYTPPLVGVEKGFANLAADMEGQQAGARSGAWGVQA
jgi:hypothetical protein